MICRRDLGQAVQNGDLLGAADMLETQVFSPGGRLPVARRFSAG